MRRVCWVVCLSRMDKRECCAQKLHGVLVLRASPPQDGDPKLESRFTSDDKCRHLLADPMDLWICSSLLTDSRSCRSCEVRDLWVRSLMLDGIQTLRRPSLMTERKWPNSTPRSGNLAWQGLCTLHRHRSPPHLGPTTAVVIGSIGVVIQVGGRARKPQRMSKQSGRSLAKLTLTS